MNPPCSSCYSTPHNTSGRSPRQSPTLVVGQSEFEGGARRFLQARPLPLLRKRARGHNPWLCRLFPVRPGVIPGVDQISQDLCKELSQNCVSLQREEFGGEPPQGRWCVPQWRLFFFSNSHPTL